MLKIYLTDLAAYNKGYLYGEWIELPMDEDTLRTKIEKILSGGSALCYMEQGYYENHEEYFITDYEWDQFVLFKVDEYDCPYDLNQQLTEVEDLDESQLKSVGYLIEEGIAENISDALTKCHNLMIHENQSLEDVAYNLVEECYDLHKLPSLITNHIDYQGIARDLEIDGTYSEIDGDTYEYIG